MLVIVDTEGKDSRLLSKKRVVQLGLLQQQRGCTTKDLPSIYSESDQGSAKGDTKSLTQRPVAGTPPSSKLVKRAALSTPRVGPVTRTERSLHDGDGGGDVPTTLPIW